ncbi:CDP-glycerol glycerophosphotransferase family protein [Angustibacter luteus]|uniref:CDP-glycerol glycerophosphotransferase family protein n=1 Tax=Angustibacter luteus TaxID=658456 RepID=A0ABW1JGW3_9ACTN
MSRLHALRRRLPGASTAHREPSAVAQHLAITQRGSVVSLTLRLREDVAVHGLWCHIPAADLWWPLPDPQPRADGAFSVQFDLVDQPAESDAAAEAGAGEGATAHLYLDVTHVLRSEEDRELRAAAPPVADEDPAPPGSPADAVRYRLRLGRFADTESEPLLPVTRPLDRTAALYISAGGNLSLLLDRPLKPFTDVHVRRISVRDGQLRLAGRLASRHEDLQDVEVLLKGRLSGLRMARPVTFAPDPERTRESFGLRWYTFSFSGHLGQLLDDEAFVDDVLDMWFVLSSSQQPEPFMSRVGKTRFLTRLMTRPGWMATKDHAAAVTPYYTFKARNTSLQFDRFEPATLRYMRRQLRWRHVLRAGRAIRPGRRPLWLVGERPNKAQDTGLAFFRYLRENHPEIDSYYVMDPSSPDYRNVAPLGNVLEYRSLEHVRAALRADRVLGSHHPDFVYPLRTKRFSRAVRATRIFLQHGVMGTKWMVPNYGKGAGDFVTDTFVVSSEREKQYIVEDFGYNEDEVAVTGLSRFDTLLAADVEPSRQLLILPTWRDWLQDDDTYPDSEYHRRWSELLHHPRLHELAETFGFEVVFCLHPNMQQFVGLFDDAPARVVSFGEVDVQDLLKHSAMLVTDYSSVGFDFSFLHRPVVYYQFDQEQFLGPRGSHLDLDAELPGPIVFQAQPLLDQVAASAAGDFVMAPEFVQRSERFLTHRDRNNSARIFDVASSAHRARAPWRRIAWRRRWRTSDQRLNRQRYWFPLMRLLFRIAKRLPADPRLVVFEAGVGRQYADSPRYLYEELVARGTDVKAVWAYNGKLHGGGPRTTVVDRLSPAYFWSLGRARYWVNNQNFPHYVRRREDGVYLQTWHGTPLKRMLHDLDVVHGRDAGYVDRVTTASQQWTSLLSPSPFATSALRSAFRYQGEVLELGYPRNDLFFAEQRNVVSTAVRRRLGIAPEKTVVLYAPTFRDNQSAGAGFQFSLPFDLEAFHEALGPDVVLLLRMHLLVKGQFEIPAHLSEHVIDASGYPEIQELYLASDVLVTDYSSVFFDFAALRRPMVFYAYDLESYRDTLRGFYLDYAATVPGPVVTTQDELLGELGDLDGLRARYADRYDAFVEQFAPRDDGSAAARVVDAVFGDFLAPPPV